MGKPWIQALLYFKLDLEIGAVIENCYPPNCLSQSEEKELCTLAFPEVQSTHDAQNKQGKDPSKESEVMNYTFRLR